MQKNTDNTPVPAPNLEQNIGHAPLRAEKITRLDSPCNVHLHSKRYRLADADGLSAKAVIDSFVYCGIFSDDSPEFIKQVTFSQEKIRRPALEETIITIEEV